MRSLKLACAVAALAAIWGGFGFAYTRPPAVAKRMADTLCRLEAPDGSGHAVVLIDVTDRRSAREAEVMLQRVLALAERLPLDTRLSVHVLTGNAAEAATPFRSAAGRMFDKCKPESAHSTSWLTGAPAVAERRYQETFVAPLKAQLAALLALPASKTSPILEALDALVVAGALGTGGDAARRRGDRADAGGYPKRQQESADAGRSLRTFAEGSHSKRQPDSATRPLLFLVSDMLSNSKTLDQYRHGPGQACAIAAGPVVGRMKALGFAGTDVEIALERNDGHAERQAMALLEVWSEVLRLAGAHSVRVNGEALTAPLSNCARPVVLLNPGLPPAAPVMGGQGRERVASRERDGAAPGKRRRGESDR